VELNPFVAVVKEPVDFEVDKVVVILIVVVVL
jgi:hypothetical protein